jgi:hypothetical protein
MCVVMHMVWMHQPSSQSIDTTLNVVKGSAAWNTSDQLDLLPPAAVVPGPRGNLTLEGTRVKYSAGMI